MKRFNFLLVSVALVLTITAVSCTTVAGTEDGYYDPGVYGRSVYVQDPYRGTVLLQQDPRTGRYYEVNPYYDGYYGTGIYGGGVYSRTYRGSGYGYPSNHRNERVYYNNNASNNSQNNTRSSEQYRRDRDDARNKVLGNR